MIHLGRVKPGSTIEFCFGSFAGSTGAPSATTNFAAADVQVYKDGGTTQRASASGITATADFDSQTGFNYISIDLSDNTTADFWAAGSRYTVVIADVTVDSQTVRFPVGTFRIGMEGALHDTTIATLSSQTSFTLTAGSADDSAYLGWLAYVHDAASAVQCCLGIVSAYTGSTKTVTLAADPAIFTMAAKDNISLYPPSLLPTVRGRTLDVSSGGEAGVDWANVGSPTTTVNLSGTTVKTATDVETDTADIQSRLPAALVSGRIDASVGAMASNTLTAAALASDAVTEIQAGLSTLDAAGVRTAVGLASANLDTQLGAIDDFLDTEIAAIKAKTDNLPSDPADASDIAASFSTVNSTLSTIAGYIDTEVAAILAAVDTEVGAIKAKTDNLPASPAATSDIPTVGSIADAVWDEAIAGHAGAGSTGEALSAAGAAGDPWITALPGSYSAGQAGYIVGTVLDATISSRASQTSLNTLDDYVDTEVAAIKAKTDLIPAAPAAVGDIPTATQNADALLNRDMSAVTDSNARSPLNALRFIRNKWSISGTTLTVTKEDDTTSAWTATVTASPGADPISGNDPT